MRSSTLVALAVSLSPAVSAFNLGFNYGSLNSDSSIKGQPDFQAEFTAAKNLVGASGFTSARLYTSIQAGTANSPISAIPAAISAGTTLLLGVWGSGGQGTVNNEIAAIQAAIAQYGTAFTSIVVGLSVGSEDLYRNSPTGIINKSGIGADPATLVGYIASVRAALQGTALSSVPIGHVDTWTAWVNGSNSAVVSACDWIGTDAYPYFQNTMANSIQNSGGLFDDAFQATVGAAQGKPVWITETGFPVSGPTSNLAVPSPANAKTYWDDVACKYMGQVNLYWYTLFDGSSSPSFGLVGGATLSSTPLFDLTCPAASSASSTPIVAQVSSPAASASGATSSAAAQNSGGLTPSGVGNGVGSISVVTSATSMATGAGTGAAGTGAIARTTASGTGSNSTAITSAHSSSSSPAFSAGSANTITGPMVAGALGAVLVIMAAL